MDNVFPSRRARDKRLSEISGTVEFDHGFRGYDGDVTRIFTTPAHRGKLRGRRSAEVDEGFSPQRHYDTTVIWTADFAEIIATSEGQHSFSIGSNFSKGQ